MTSRDLAAQVARLPRVALDDFFYRHVKPGYHSLEGSLAGGRWGPPHAFPVLYLSHPEESAVIEAYRWLVDDVEGMRPELVGPRDLLTCRVTVSQVVDLRDVSSQEALGLTTEVLHSPADDPDAYSPCQTVGRAAHQLELHGILAPAAGGMQGETLALYPRNLPMPEIPELTSVETWPQLPHDPRVLRGVEDEDRRSG